MALNASIFFFLSDQHSVALQFQMIVQVGLRECCGFGPCVCFCARVQQALVKSGKSAVDTRYWILVLVMAPCFCRKCSRSWLLWRKCKLHFSHCRANTEDSSSVQVQFLDSCHLCIMQVKVWFFFPHYSHGKVFLLCVCADDSWASAGAGIACHRFHRDMASLPCGSGHGHAGEPPVHKIKNEHCNTKHFNSVIWLTNSMICIHRT